MARLEHNDTDRRMDPRETADKLIHSIDLDDLGADEKIALARVLLDLAAVDAARDANLIGLHNLISGNNEQGRSDRNVLRNVLRYRVRVLPPLRGIVDGLRSNGGE